MEPEDDLDVIGVLRSHLEEINSVLRNARTYHEAMDLVDRVNRGKANLQPSWLSRELDRAVRRTEGYLSVDDGGIQ